MQSLPMMLLLRYLDNAVELLVRQLRDWFDLPRHWVGSIAEQLTRSRQWPGTMTRYRCADLALEHPLFMVRISTEARAEDYLLLVQDLDLPRVLTLLQPGQTGSVWIDAINGGVAIERPYIRAVGWLLIEEEAEAELDPMLDAPVEASLIVRPEDLHLTKADWEWSQHRYSPVLGSHF